LVVLEAGRISLHPSTQTLSTNQASFYLPLFNVQNSLSGISLPYRNVTRSNVPITGRTLIGLY
jgi:hypothetical protein